MAVEITGYLMLEKETMETLVPNRTIEYIISLDEGHDRPVWQWVKSPNPGKKSAWVPEKPETVLMDGFFMLIADGLQDFGWKSKIDAIRMGSNALVDLNVNRLEIDPRGQLANALQGHKLCVVAFPGSSLIGLSKQLTESGLEHRLLT